MMVSTDELIEKQNKLIEKMWFNLKQPDLFISPYPYEKLMDEVNGLYRKFKEEEWKQRKMKT